MGTIEASKYTSLTKLLAIKENNYRGYHNKSGQVKDYDKASVDNLIAQKQSKLDNTTNDDLVDQWDDFEAEQVESAETKDPSEMTIEEYESYYIANNEGRLPWSLDSDIGFKKACFYNHLEKYNKEKKEAPKPVENEQDKRYFQSRIKYLDKARAYYDSNGDMETAREYQKEIEEIEAKIYPKKPLDKALATIDKRKEEQKKVLRQTVKIIKELHLNGTYSGSQTIECLKRIAKDLENATGHRISFTKEVKRKPVETKAVTNKRHIDPKHSVRNWGYIYPNEYSSQNHVMQKYSLIDGEVVTIITLNGKPTTTTKYPKMTPKQLDELTKIYKEI